MIIPLILLDLGLPINFVMISHGAGYELMRYTYNTPTAFYINVAETETCH